MARTQRVGEGQCFVCSAVQLSRTEEPRMHEQLHKEAKISAVCVYVCSKKRGGYNTQR